MDRRQELVLAKVLAKKNFKTLLGACLDDQYCEKQEMFASVRLGFSTGY